MLRCCCWGATSVDNRDDMYTLEYRVWQAGSVGDMAECVKIIKECKAAERGRLGSKAMYELLVHYCYTSKKGNQAIGEDARIVNSLLKCGAETKTYFPCSGEATFYVFGSYSLFGSYLLSIAASTDVISAQTWNLILQANLKQWQKESMHSNAIDHGSMKLQVTDTLQVCARTSDPNKLAVVFDQCISLLSQDDINHLFSKGESDFFIKTAIQRSNLTYIQLLLKAVSKDVLPDIVTRILPVAILNNKTAITTYILSLASIHCHAHLQNIVTQMLDFALRTYCPQNKQQQLVAVATLLQVNCDIHHLDYATLKLQEMREVSIAIRNHEIMILEMLHSLGNPILTQLNLTEEDLVDVTDPGNRTKILDLVNQPLSLKQLCRIQVRLCLQSTLIYAIEQLPLPQTIKDYVMLREWPGLL